VTVARNLELVSMSDWYPFKNGESIGQTGSESGKILRDEEHGDGARVTLGHVRNNRFTITCGIYGWMVHTRFFDSETAALMGFDETKEGLGKILALIPLEEEGDDERMNIVTCAIADLVDRCE
jgi:hypothetical protein